MNPRPKPWFAKSLLFCMGVGIVTLASCGKKAAENEDDRESPESVKTAALAPVVIGSGEGEWKQLDDPSADGWDSEVQSERIKKQLDALSEAIVNGEISSDFLSGIVTEDFSSSELVPGDVVTEFEESGWRVRRGQASGRSDLAGATGFADALMLLTNDLGAETGDLRCKIKVIEFLDRDGEISTRQLVELSQPGVEIHAEWTLEWELGDPPLIRTLQVGKFERTTSGSQSPLFRDCTESALAANPSFHEQIAFGANHWLGRIQDTRKMTLLGTPGAALGDVNGDGLDDLYLCQAGGLPNRLYLQNPDGTVRDASEAAGVGWVESSRSALIVDFDNDGDQDLAVATYARIVLAENDGTGKFAVAAILDVGVGTMGLSAVDFDQDGDLDLYACQYSAGDLESEAGATVIGAGGSFVYHDANNGGANHFFKNEISDADGWRFPDITEACGLDANNRRFSLAASWEDFDDDGDQDLYVANDFGRNNLYRNDEGHFTDIAAQIGGEDRASGMSVSWGDANRDGRMDLYVGNMFSAAGGRIARQSAFSPGSTDEERDALLRFARGNTLLVQQDGGFADQSLSAGVTMGRWAWSSLFADINNDGWEDLLVANGYITTPDSGDL